MPLTVGTRLGPYEIQSPIGTGGMGEVYRARDPRLGRDVAVKVLPAGLSADPERLTRFEQEARAAAARASCSNRVRRSGSVDNPAGKTLTATSRPRRGSRAR